MNKKQEQEVTKTKINENNRLKNNELPTVLRFQIIIVIGFVTSSRFSVLINTLQPPSQQQKTVQGSIADEHEHLEDLQFSHEQFINLRTHSNAA